MRTSSKLASTPHTTILLFLVTRHMEEVLFIGGWIEMVLLICCILLFCALGGGERDGFADLRVRTGT